MASLPKPKSPNSKLCDKKAAINAVKNDGKIPGRVYIDKSGVEHPWVCDENPQMWRGQIDED